MSMQEPAQLDLNTPVPITLPLGAWNTILGLIMEGPWKVSDPIVQVIRQQIAQVAQSRQPKMQMEPVLHTTREAPRAGEGVMPVSGKAGEDGQPS